MSDKLWWIPVDGVVALRTHMMEIPHANAHSFTSHHDSDNNYHLDYQLDMH